MRDRNGRYIRDRPFEFKNIETVYENSEESEHIGLKYRQLNINYSDVNDFYVRGQEETEALVEAITESDVIMEELTSDEINRMIKMGKERFAGCDAGRLRKMAASTALMTILAMYRGMYVSDCDECD